MPKFIIATVLVALAASPAALAAQADYEEQCRVWAQEDEVDADQVEDYVAECLEEQRANAAENSSEQQDEPVEN